MTACEERVYTLEAGDLGLLETALNDFIKTKVSRVVDLQINPIKVMGVGGYYAFLRYTPT